MFCGVVACPYPIGCVLHSTTIDAERVTARHGEIESSRTSSAAIALRTLFMLKTRLNDLRRRSSELDLAVGCKNERAALDGLLGVRHAFEKIAVAYTRLRTHVIAFDGAELGDSIESLGELGVRAEMFVAAVQLSRIGAAVTRGEIGAAGARRLFAGRFCSIDDVVGFVCRELGRINALWLPHRNGRQTRVQLHTIPTERATEERALRYRAAIRDAQRELTALANESNLGPFLRAAAACDWPEVRSAASLIDIALQMDLTVEPDLSWVSGGAVPMRTHVGVPAGKL